MKEHIYGLMNVQDDKVDITDPCYNRDTWCRINNLPITSGSYECYVRIADDSETEGWGERIAVCGIRDPKKKADFYEAKGMIGVDAGLAGFFCCDNRKVFEEEILPRNVSVRDVFKGDQFFCTSSGIGDGSYTVYAGYSDDNLVEVFIEFLEDC